MLQGPAIVVVVREREERAVAEHVAQLAVHQLRAVVDHLVVDPEFMKLVCRRADRLRASLNLVFPERQSSRLRRRNRHRVDAVSLRQPRRLRQPPDPLLRRELLRPVGLIVGEPLVQPSGPPLVVSQNAVREDVPGVVRDMALQFCTDGILGNTEWRSGWLDEGLTNYQTDWAEKLTPQERIGRLPEPPRLPEGYRVNAVTIPPSETGGLSLWENEI